MNKNTAKYTNSRHIYHRIPKASMFKHTRVFGLLFNDEYIAVTKGKTIWLIDSDYITAMQEPDFR